MKEISFEWDSSKAGIECQEAWRFLRGGQNGVLRRACACDPGPRSFFHGRTIHHHGAELRIARSCRCSLFPQERFVDPSDFGTTSRNEGTATLLGEPTMRKEYDFSKAKPNPYVKRLKKAVTIRLEPDVIDYFKTLSGETGIPYQNLINLYLMDCAKEQRRLALTWKK
jgi:uncharacterized protein (DUF4415 family)